MTIVIGFCRFSYPAKGGFQVEHSSIEDREAFLYAADRLEERFRLFEHITLPALKAQTDPDFQFIVLIGQSLPDPALTRLRDLLADLPQARIVARAPQPHRKVCQEVINLSRGTLDNTCLQFRMDDDDAVAIDFVQELRSAAEESQGLLRHNGTMAIDFCLGVELSAHGPTLLAEERQLGYATAGLGYVAGPGRPLSVMNFNHSKMSRFMPTVTLSHKPMFVRSLNQFNDSRLGKKTKEKPLPPATQEIRQLLRDRFSINPERLATRLG